MRQYVKVFKNQNLPKVCIKSSTSAFVRVQSKLEPAAFGCASAKSPDLPIP